MNVRVRTVSIIRPTFHENFATIVARTATFTTGSPQERPNGAHVPPGLSFVLIVTKSRRAGRVAADCKLFQLVLPRLGNLFPSLNDLFELLAVGRLRGAGVARPQC